MAFGLGSFAPSVSEICRRRGRRRRDEVKFGLELSVTAARRDWAMMCFRDGGGGGTMGFFRGTWILIRPRIFAPVKSVRSIRAVLPMKHPH